MSCFVDLWTTRHKRGTSLPNYVSQALLQYREQDAGSVSRVSAQSVEDVVVDVLRNLLRTPAQLLGLFAQDHLPAVHRQQLMPAAQALAERWDHLRPSNQIEHLKALIRSIRVSRRELRIALSRSGIQKTLLRAWEYAEPENGSAGDEHPMSVPVQLKRCGFETKLVVPTNDNSRANPTSSQAIQKALARGLAWNRALITGEVSSVSELAKREKICRRYVARLIQLAFLAPDIVRAIGRGDIPPILSVDLLKRGFPLDWKKQRQLLGFAQNPLNRD